MAGDERLYRNPVLNPGSEVPGSSRFAEASRRMLKTLVFGMGRGYLPPIKRRRRTMAKAKRAAIYLRVSTDSQTTDNQRRELEAAAEARGWEVVAVYADEGISGAKGRDNRPQLDLMLKDAVRRKFDVAMVWAVDRLGRSLPDLIASMQELHGAKVDLFMLQQGIDTTTPADGRCSACW